MTAVTTVTTPAGRADGLTEQAQQEQERGRHMEPLTDEQVQNWRCMLCQMFGPLAFIMYARSHRRISCADAERAILLDAELPTT